MALTWPTGFRSAGIPSGIRRSGRADLGILLPDGNATWAGVFTTNAAAAAPVAWSRRLLGRDIRAVVVNSGNANACTGEDGEAAVARTAQCVAGEIGCSPAEVAVASTGPIGVRLPVEKILDAIPPAVAAATTDVDPFAQAILTTDSRTKTAFVTRSGFRVVGVAKGAAMLAPNMATMLAFLATDAAVDGQSLQAMLATAVDRSFNRVSIDGCESTNDSVFLLSSATAPAVEEDSIADAVQEACLDLAAQIARDAEGGSKFVRVRVTGAADEHHAAALGKGVAASSLWRCAIHGSDPNWGRIVAALGSTDRGLDPRRVDVWIGRAHVFASGEPRDALGEAAREMADDEVVVHVAVGVGKGEAEVLTADLSPAYVDLNASGST